jgi:hypothetical protein
MILTMAFDADSNGLPKIDENRKKYPNIDPTRFSDPIL